MSDFVQDLKYGFRSLREKPGFALAAIGALALGIGANTAIFSVVNGVLLKPLPFEEADRVMTIISTAPAAGYPRIKVSAADFLDWQAETTVFEQMALMRTTLSYNLSGQQEAERIQGAPVTVNLFSLLRAKPFIGRTFTSQEADEGRNHVVVLGHGLWQRRFGGDPGVIGRKIQLNGLPYEVIGVMPRGFQFPSKDFELWVPHTFDPEEVRARMARSYNVFARLKPGATVERARAELSAITTRLELADPKRNPKADLVMGVLVQSLRDDMVRDIRGGLLVLLGAVGCVLLIACANVANLLLSHAVARQKEITLRAALGATRGRLVRQLLTEILPVTCVGAFAGLLLAIWGIEYLLTLVPGSLPRFENVHMDAPVFAFTLCIAIVTSVLCGLAPALEMSRTELNDVLKQGGRSGSGGNRRLRELLVIGEIALSLVLLVGAGLLIRSFLRLQQVDTGIQPGNIITMQIALAQAKDYSGPIGPEFYRQLVHNIEALPAVESAGAVNRLPLNGSIYTMPITVEGVPKEARRYGDTDLRAITPDYFRAIGIRLLRGRQFNEHDTATSMSVAIVDERVARICWPGEDPLGKRIKIGFSSSVKPWSTVVGVVNNVKNDGVDVDSRGQIYWPLPQEPNARMALVARTRGNPLDMVAAIKGEVKALDANQPVFDIRTMEDVVSASVAQRRFTALLLGLFALLALILSLVGIYAVMSYAVTQRTQEIGVRVALGATTGDVVRLVVGRSAVLVACGLGAGLIFSWILTRFLSSLLFGVSATDLVTYSGVSLVLAAVALIASYVPAHRAARVNPVEALRT
jgi:predicted permease